MCYFQMSIFINKIRPSEHKQNIYIPRPSRDRQQHMDNAYETNGMVWTVKCDF